eukprot:TRINITY_DN61763_c0_g1_i1.p1 TRINITY_DN61763_c0_g1~~TRINITY_DN61763_c0_g1_i1.p1  ORF type:complete len:205 (-),score=58.91 TRINITY_DN61763_c0_g1_i1:348-962(-)
MLRSLVGSEMCIRDSAEMVKMLGCPSASVIKTLPAPWPEFLNQFPPAAGLLQEQCLVMAQPAMDIQAVDLIQRLLTFLPSSRCSASEAARHLFLQPDESLAPSTPRFSPNPLSVSEQELKDFEENIEMLIQSGDWEAEAVKLIGRQLDMVGIGSDDQPAQNSTIVASDIEPMRLAAASPVALTPCPGSKSSLLRALKDHKSSEL